MQAPFADPLLKEQLTSALPLVGRDAERQLARTLLHTVANDVPQGARALTLSGEMGIGKTRLLAAICQEARHMGFRLLEATAYETNSQFPYFPFIEALRPFLRSSTPEQLLSYIGITSSPESETTVSHTPHITLQNTSLVTILSHLFPELLSMLPIEPIQKCQTLSPEQEKFHLFEALATLLERITHDHPLLFAIDNLQWADSASLELTLYLTIRLHKSRIALIGATRPPIERGHEDLPITMTTNNAVIRALSDLMRRGMLLFLPLAPLHREAAIEHLQALLSTALPQFPYPQAEQEKRVTPAASNDWESIPLQTQRDQATIHQSVAETLLNRAEGNPFFLEELVRALTVNQQLVLRNGMWKVAAVRGIILPNSIVLAVKQRLQGLSAGCRIFVQIAALFGRTFLIDALISLLEKSTDEIQAYIHEAVEASIIAQFPSQEEDHYLQTTRYIFCQGIVHEILQAELPTHQARTLHAELGKTLEAMYGPHACEHAAELAHHYTLGGMQEATLRWSFLAGENAARLQAYREAINYFRRVLKLLEAHGDDNEKSAVNLPTRAELYLITGELWFKLGEIEQAGSIFQQALAHFQKHSREASPLLLARTHRLLADVYRIQAKYEQALAHLQAARTALDKETETHKSASNVPAIRVAWLPGRSFSTGIPIDLERYSISERIQFLQAQAMLEILLNRAVEAEPVLWQAHQLATEIGDHSNQAYTLQMMSWIRGWGEHIHETIRFQKQANDLYFAIGDPFRAALVEQGLGSTHQAIGEMELANLYTQRGLQRAHRHGVRGVLGWLYWNQGSMALCVGQWEKSEGHLQEALQEALDTDNVRLKAIALQAQAELQFRRGNWSAAEALFQSAIQAATNTDWLPSTLVLYGHFLAITGRRIQAHTQFTRASEYPEPSGFSGDFYIPFLVEGYLHLDAAEQAAPYIERIQKQRDCLYYGNAVDRILGIVATHMHNWEAADQAFEEALALCRRAHNEPEEAVILYEKARLALIRHAPLRDIHELCTHARALFLQYEMQKAVTKVDALQEGAEKLAQAEKMLTHKDRMPSTNAVVQESPGGYARELALTKRELEVLRLVAEGHMDREVAAILVISPRTVNRHLSNIFVKLDVPGRAAAVAYAIRQGLV